MIQMDITSIVLIPILISYQIKLTCTIDMIEVLKNNIGEISALNENKKK